MVSDISNSTYGQTSFVPLVNRNSTSTGNIYDVNLFRKATQLIKDIEYIDQKPSFESYLAENSIDLNQLFNVNPQDFADFVSAVKSSLEKDDKPLTVLNFIEAQNSLLGKEEKDVDIET